MVVKKPTHLNFCHLKEFSEADDFRFNSDLHVGHLGACHLSLEDQFWQIKSTFVVNISIIRCNLHYFE